MMDIDDTMLTALQSADFGGFIKLAATYADVVSTGNETKKSEKINKLLREVTSKKTEVIDHDEDIVDSYYNLYNALLN